MATLHPWNFVRAGGFDQLRIKTGADLLALERLDQKLWAALSCPTRGQFFDRTTLEWIDRDGDGQIRANELLEAVRWAGSMLNDPQDLIDNPGTLALQTIRTDHEAGLALHTAAEAVLQSLGKGGADRIALQDVQESARQLAARDFNGDGVVCPARVQEAALRAGLEAIAGCMGTVQDASGDPGLDDATVQRFFEQAAAFVQWQAQGQADPALLPLGDATAAAHAALLAVQGKVDDYFTRCRLAQYDARAEGPLNRAESDYQQLAPLLLSPDSAALADFPLSKVGAEAVLGLEGGVNPAWQSALQQCRALAIEPLLGARSSLNETEWCEVKSRLAPFGNWQAAKPDMPVAMLGAARLTALLQADFRAAWADALARDRAVADEVQAVRELERLLRYVRDLHALANNFVSFASFYAGTAAAMFQFGTLYLDGRSCDLCMKVDQVAAHAAFAAGSGLCLVYCECVHEKNGQKMYIAAAVTAGDTDFLRVGRNGVFYDREGQDWNASVVRVIEQPISLPQAFWRPYKRLVRMIGEQVQKFASARESSVEKQSAGAVSEGAQMGDKAKAGFDVAKFAGIFAAIGLAIGAIGGVLTAVASGILSLEFWQMPLALAGLMLLISGPSVLLAWLKLRQRTLGPVLDACGWAINARLLINVPFGASLTQVARLPEGASRSLKDPYPAPVVWPYWLLALMVVIGAWWGFASGGLQ